MVTLVATTGTRSMDLYARKLAEYLTVPKLHTDIYQKAAGLFNVSPFSWTALRVGWADWRFIKMLNQHKGIFHLPNHHLGRYGHFLKAPFIITVHDLARYFDLMGYATFIQPLNLRDRLYLTLDYRGIRKATHIIAVSHATKHDLMEHLSIPEKRISVVHEAVDHRVFRPVPDRLVDHPYILYVGSEHPRKNLTTLLKAFSTLKQDGRFADLKLVKVGSAGRPESYFRQQTLQTIRALGLSSEVIFTGYVAEKDLPVYYSGAACFVLPSLTEGFGLTPLEAMACGCPTIVSNIPALSEICGEATLVVDPSSPDDLARAMSTILTHDGLREGLVAQGLRRAQRFTWEKVARETMQVYDRVEQPSMQSAA